MAKQIFPKEIIQFSVEKHYNRFSGKSNSIYLLFTGSVILFLVAMPFIKIDITVQSRGIIRSQTEPTTIQTPVIGQISEIRIFENMKVNKGDTLIRLSPDKIKDQLAILEAKTGQYSDYINDLEMLESSDTTRPLSELIQSSYTEYSKKLNEYQTRINTIEKEFSRAKTLFEKDVIPAAEFERKDLELNQLQKEKEFYISQKKNYWQQMLFQYKLEYQTLVNQSEQLKFEERFYVVVSPSNGYISNFNGVKPGSFIFPNQTIATVTPSDSLIVECYVSPNDIGYLHLGKSATFQIDAYNYNQWGLATGEITDISNQPYQENQNVFFKIKCRLNEESLALKTGYSGKLKNGFTLTSRFMVTRRSLYDLLFDKADNWFNPKIMTATK